MKFYPGMHLDYALLSPTLTRKQLIDQLSNLPPVRSVCVLPHHVGLAKIFGLKVSTVIGWPFGQGNKVDQAHKSIHDGADELDVVINYSAILDNCLDFAVREIEDIKAMGRMKVILEANLWTTHQLHMLCRAFKAHYLKTCTGYLGDARIEHVKIMKEYAPVKASGGISTKEQAQKFMEAGCSIIGSSSLSMLTF